MEQRIRALLPTDRHTLRKVNDPELYIADWTDWSHKNRKKGADFTGIKITSDKQEINTIQVLNPDKREIIYDIFGDNALPVEKTEKECRQCECVLFPHDTTHPGHWVLFVELKYAYDEMYAFRKESDYPSSMVKQIIETVNYFRTKGILNTEKKVHAIVAFPNLEFSYHERFSLALQESDFSVEEILKTHKIIIRACNQVSVISPKRIKWTNQ
ncbi:MAG: hypothetical protein LUG98_10220 [Tannerellaceae bacterium]|nr:hypothetical protein [Tannerellaceae bacterium]